MAAGRLGPPDTASNLRCFRGLRFALWNASAGLRVLKRELRQTASVMIEKFAGVRGLVLSEFLDLNHTSKLKILVSLMIPKFAPEPGTEQRRTSESGH
jgi:hypothetical protein